jgi:Fe-Mn family superoxide dismutase
MFWTIMGPKGGGKPGGDLAKAIDSELGGFDKFKEALTKAGVTRFGSGWAWLSVDKSGKLGVESTPNQDNPYMIGKTPILGVDVWEHAYYLLYQNRRPDYLAAWWNTVDWSAVENRYKAAKG